MNITDRLKAALWHRYGNSATPAEWDGRTYGGGKVSQRFWEYHQAIELLDLTTDSVILDIGGGSPITGAGFFSHIVAPHVRQVHIMDVNIGNASTPAPNIVLHRALATQESLSIFLAENPHVTHIACISVFEHIPHDVRCGMIKAINEHFTGNIFACTLEYHSQECFFEDQLTVRTLSNLFEGFTNFYPDRISSSPVLAENAYSKPSILRRGLRKLNLLKHWNRVGPGVPLWYPLALRFCRAS